MAAVTLQLPETSTTPPPTTVSVVLCAGPASRWDQLVAGIDGLERQTRRPDQVVVVIDHDDDLLERAADFFAARDTPLAIDVVANTRAKGPRGARNAGVSWSVGEVIAFLGDDTRTGDDYWVATMLEDYTTADVAGVGGGATADCDDGEPPAWFPPEFGWVIDCSHVGLPEDIADTDDLLGCNMSFRREVFDELGGFGDESSELCVRLRRRYPSARLVFDPDLEVTHTVRAVGGDFAYFRDRCWHAGRSGAGACSQGRYLTRVLPLGVARSVADGVRGRAGGFRRAGAIVVGLMWILAGQASGHLTSARNPRFAYRRQR